MKLHLALIASLATAVSLLALTGSPLAAETYQVERVDDLPAVTILASHQETRAGMPELEYTSSPIGSKHSWHHTLERMPGVLAQESFGGFDPPRLSIRGSGIQSAPVSRGLIMNLNGFPFNFADGSFNLTLLDGSWIKEIALIPGPAAGAFALGGELSLNTMGNWQGERSSITSVMGSHQSRSAIAQLQTTHGQTRWVVEGSISRMDGWRAHASQQRESLLVTTNLKITADTQLVFQVFGSRPRYEVPGPLPLKDALNNPEKNLQRVLLDQPRRETEYLQIGAKLNASGPQFRYTAGVAVTGSRDEFYQLLPNGISDTQGRESSVFGNFVKDWNTESEQQTRLHLLVQQGWNRVQRHSTLLGSRGVALGDNDLRPLSMNLSASHRIAWSKHHALEGGFSFLSAHRVIKERFQGRESTALHRSDREIAPRLAWLWRMDQKRSLSLSWARTYEAPSNTDLLFTEFAPPPPLPRLRTADLNWQRADALEIRIQGTSRHGNWSAALYHSRWKGEFLRLKAEDGSALGTVNADRTTHMGCEGFWEHRLVQHPGVQLDLWTTFQVNAIRFDDDPVYGTRYLGGIPKYHGSAGLLATTQNGWSIAPACSWQAGKTYADHANTLASEGYAVLSLDLGYSHPGGLGMNFRVSNALDESYVASSAGMVDEATGPNQPLFLPGSGRRMEFRIQYHW